MKKKTLAVFVALFSLVIAASVATQTDSAAPADPNGRTNQKGTPIILASCQGKADIA